MAGNTATLEKTMIIPNETIIYGQHPNVTRLLLSKNVDPTTEDNLALVVACKMGALETVHLLLNAGCDPTALNNKPLEVAAENGYDDIVTLLLQQYNVQVTEQARNMATQYGHERVLCLLLDHIHSPVLNVETLCCLDEPGFMLPVVPIPMLQPFIFTRAAQAVVAPVCTFPEQIQLDEIRKIIGVEPQVFNSSMLYLSSDDPQVNFFERCRQGTETVIGWGQLKLLLTEIQALLLWDQVKYPQLTVVCAGAAPGHHFLILAQMFPTIIWHLYDPRAFKINESKHIKLHSEYFTDEIASSWKNNKKHPNVFFFSDIRSESHKDLSSADLERAIKEEMDMQQRWVIAMDPYMAHLKMRLPFIIPGIQEKEFTHYLAGDIMFQSYNGPSSTETRLIPRRDSTGKYYKIIYNNRKYESQLFYHNIVRETALFKNPIGTANTTDVSDDARKLSDLANEEQLTALGLDRKFDATHLIYILGLFLQRSQDTVTLHDVLNLIADTMQKLNKIRKRPVSLQSLRKEDIIKRSTRSYKPNTDNA
jgi:hypothetical protein